MNIADINTEARALVDATTTSYAAPLLLVRVNTAMEEIASLILNADGRWQWDDANNVDYPSGVAGLQTMTNGTQAYSIDTTFIKILGVSVKAANGIWRKLIPFDPDDLTNPLLDKSQFLNVSGLPYYYDLTASYVNLYPPPDNGVSVTLTNGLKIYAQRTAQLFTAADVTTGTKVPGFPSIFHSLVAYMAALPYAQAYKPARVQFIMEEIARKKADMTMFFSKRDKDERHVLTPKPIIFK